MKQTAKSKAIDLFRAGFSVDQVAFMARITVPTARNYKSQMHKKVKQ